MDDPPKAGQTATGKLGADGQGSGDLVGELPGAGMPKQPGAVDVDEVEGDGRAIGEPLGLGDDLLGDEVRGHRVEDLGDVERSGIAPRELAGGPERVALVGLRMVAGLALRRRDELAAAAEVAVDRGA
jgi:hypothetical protein